MTTRKKRKAADAGEREAFQTTNNSGNGTRFDQLRDTYRVTTRTRTTRRARYDDIMAAALRIACDIGYNRVNRDDIALAAGCSPSLVSELFGTMVATRRSIIRAAVANHVLPVIAQGLALRDPHALRAPAELRALAAGSIVCAGHGAAARQRSGPSGKNLGFECANTVLNWPATPTEGLRTGSLK